MKKAILIIVILLLLTAPFILIENAKAENGKWSKVNSYIYVDKSSITKGKYLVSGWFKIYNSPESELYSITDKNVHYELVKYEVDCKDPAIYYAHSKSYDKNGNLLLEDINTHGVACSCPCVVNDDIYVRELCK